MIAPMKAWLRPVDSADRDVRGRDVTPFADRPALAALTALAALSPVALATIALAISATTIEAQPAWRESTSPSERFVVLWSEEAPAASALVDGVDPIHDGLSALLGGRLPGPITVKIHPSREAFLAANPLVARSGDIDAGTRRARREIEIYHRAAGSGAAETALERDVRYEMAHLFIARQSGGRMSPGLQEGLARYLSDRPAAEDEPGRGVVSGVARLREAWRRDALKSWDELSAPGAAYTDPEIAQPQSLSIIHFLVEVEGLGAVLELVSASAEAEGWRDALDRAFTRSPGEFEAAWRLWRPGYLDGGWRQHELYEDGVARAERLIREGRYEVARDRLRATLPLLERDDPGGAARARALLARSEQGVLDAADLAAAHSALTDGRYDVADRLASAVVERRSDGQPDDRAGRTAQEIRDRARIGRQATSALQEAIAGSVWQSPLARRSAARAASGFSQLGDELRAEEARAVHSGRGSALGPIGLLLIAAGCAVLIRNGMRRHADRLTSAGPGDATVGPGDPSAGRVTP